MVKYIVDKCYLVQGSYVSYESPACFNTYEEAKQFCLDNMIFLEDNEAYDILAFNVEDETSELIDTVAFEEEVI